MRTTLCVLATLAIAAAPAGAQPTFEKKGNAEDVKDVKDVNWTAKGELSVVQATGNARTTAIAATANAVRKDPENKLELTFSATYARATTRTAVDANMDGAIDETELDTATATSAENAQTKLRYDRYFSALDAGFVTALGGTDQPAGKDFFGGGQIGYSRGLFKNPCHEVLGEIGYDLTYVKLAAGSSTTIHSARLFAGYKGKLKEDAALEGSVEALLNGTNVTYGMREAGAFEATRVTATIGLTAGLSTKISLGASFTAKYENFPAPLAKIGAIPFAGGFEPAAEKLDTTTKVSLVVKFL